MLLISCSEHGGVFTCYNGGLDGNLVSRSLLVVDDVILLRSFLHK